MKVQQRRRQNKAGTLVVSRETKYGSLPTGTIIELYSKGVSILGPKTHTQL